MQAKLDVDVPELALTERRSTLQLYQLFTGEDDARICRDIPEDQCKDQPVNFVTQVTANALSKTGDALADSKIVLPWLLGVVGAPLFFLGLLVPIRESLALLPQILFGSLIRRYPIRKGFWAVSSIVQGGCVIAMGAVAAFGVEGIAAGSAIIGLLVIFSCARGVASIAAKDTMGKTVSKGKRGKVSGYAATASGVFAGLVGLYLVLGPADARPEWLLYLLLIVAGLCWFAAAVVFNQTREYPGATDGGRSFRDVIGDQVRLLLSDAELQKFLLARALMISTGLATPVYVLMAQAETGSTLNGLGWLIVAAGFAGAISSSVWGAFSDQSSRMTMAAGAAVAGGLGLVVVCALTLLPGLASHIEFFAVVLFISSVAHAGVRIGRKTHIVDLAGGDRKAEYVALSNTLIGVILLILGVIGGVLLEHGALSAVAAFAFLALLGAVCALRLRNVQEDFVF
jgi:MFS family permease